MLAISHRGWRTLRQLLGPVLLIILTSCARPTSQLPALSPAEIEAERRHQVELLVEQLVREQSLVARAKHRVFTAASDFCSQRGYSYGILLIDSTQIEDPLVRSAFLTKIGATTTDPGLYIVDIAPDSLMSGELPPRGSRVLKLNGAAASDLDHVMRIVQENPIITVEWTLGDRIASATLHGKLACSYPVLITQDPHVNAWTDGNRIMITRQLIQFARDEQELAFVLAHELAHNIKGHVEAKMRNAVLGGLGGLVLDVLAAAAGVNTQGAFTRAAMQAGALAYSQEFEAEADYVALYILARAEYSIDGVEQFWRRMAALQSDRAIWISKTHPTTPERYVLIRKTADEIEAKRQRGEPLVPSERESAAAVQTTEEEEWPPRD